MMNPALQLPGPGPVVTQQDDETDIRSYLDTVLDNRGLIATIALTVSLIGIGYAFTARPVYETNLMIHVEESTNKDTKNILGEMNSLFEYKTDTAAEMELLQSRLVISRAIDNLRLYVHASPKRFPLIGNMVAKYNKDLSSPGIFGMGGYTWGAEKIDVSAFNVPDALLNKQFILTVGENGQYRLRQAEDRAERQERHHPQRQDRQRHDRAARRPDRGAAGRAVLPGPQFAPVDHRRRAEIADRGRARPAIGRDRRHARRQRSGRDQQRAQ
jgi:tyrosine-protein kinase Etk/Wzc